MSYRSDLKLYSKFDTTALYEEISMSFWDVVGNSTVTVLSNGLGYVMQRDQHLTLTQFPLGVSTGMTMGFWLYPVSPGVVLDGSNSTQPIKSQVLNFSGDDSVYEYGGLQSFSIHEICYEGNENRLVVEMTNDDGGTYSATSQKYTTGVWHYIWITMNGDNRSCHLILDGKTSEWHSESGTVPIRIDGTSVSFGVNQKTVFGQYDWLNNAAYIDDLIILNDDYNSEQVVERVLSLGVTYFVDTSYLDYREVTLGVFENDPTVIRSTSMTNEGTSLYATRNDGKILKGSSLIWDLKRNLNTTNELNDISDNPDRIFSSSDDKSSSYSISNGYLQISNCTIRF